MYKVFTYEEPITVLVVEDNDGDFILVEDYLHEKFKNIEIVRRKDFKGTVLGMEKNRSTFSAILLDIHLQDGSGLELIKKVLTYAKDIPILILTGYTDVSIAQLSLQLGVYDFLVKDELNPNLLYKSIVFAVNRRQFISQIESERSNFEDLFNFSPQPMWLLDAYNYNVLNANLSAIEKYGYALEEYKKMTYFELHPKEEVENIVKRLSNLQLQLANNNFTHFLKNGEQIKVDFYCKKVKGDTNGPERIIVQSNDITETLNHIQTIETQNKKLRNIAWTQSHEVRGPLARILGIIELIDGNDFDGEELPFWLKQLKISSNELDQIIHIIVDQTQTLNLKD
ncbi:response regulator [Maribacter cobaltidurans]|uniref:histidine kinase n=1 Tax=Maribacter cobaltidurans TaxID=1178778 RepID=A0A223V1E9_9FLAO|nr:response regulator [Maribacter cobaltidurans]ASV28980.1 hypothetical protein CJ263_01350 [Maribacter cobaltidurans]GGD72963.1 hypothetical protein GCM10011412_08240 [Maribacter cobaltidurans]